MKKTITAIIQARMGSSRLPGKTLKLFCGKPSLEHFIERIRQSQLLDRIVVATSTLTIDDVIEDLCERVGIFCFRGSEWDVLDRYYQAALQYPSDIYVRMTADCPLIDPYVIDDTIQYFLDNTFDYVSNGESLDYGLSFPRGLDCEVFTSQLLKEAWGNGIESYEREHVTPYMYWKKKNISVFRNADYQGMSDVSQMRWTLDTPEDYEMINAIYEGLYRGLHNFYLRDILDFLHKHPEIAAINSHIQQKKVR